MVFGLCWAPFHVDRLMWSLMDASLEGHLRIFQHVHVVSGVFFYLSAAVNPVLYNLMSTRFRELFRHIWCRGGDTRSLRSSLAMSQKARRGAGWTPTSTLTHNTAKRDG